MYMQGDILIWGLSVLLQHFSNNLITNYFIFTGTEFMLLILSSCLTFSDDLRPLVISNSVTSESQYAQYARARASLSGSNAFPLHPPRQSELPNSRNKFACTEEHTLWRNITQMLDPNFAIIGTADSGRCRCVTPKGTCRGCEISRPGGAYNRVYKFAPPPRPKEEVFKLFEPKRVERILLP